MIVHKYEFPLTDNFTLSLPIGSRILKAGWQGKHDAAGYPILCFWVLRSETESEVTERRFMVYGTGHAGISPVLNYVDSVFQQGFVWHIFELKDPPPYITPGGLIKIDY